MIGKTTTPQGRSVSLQ